MLFSSQPFLLLFLPFALALYYAAASSYRLRLSALALASFTFYGWWDLRFLPLLVVLITANWAIGRLYLAWGRPAWLINGGLLCNLAVLGLFKYANFFAESVLSAAGISFHAWNLILPLGISFFTFQHLSYLIDLRRNEAPAYSLLEFANYVGFFAHLIAGPIVRHNELIPQFALPPRRAEIAELFGRGLVLFGLGLVKKVFFADELAPLADAQFAAAADPMGITTAAAWVAAGAYSLQLYFDFSAYSDMAMGLAGMFGFVFPLNFDRPYRATNIREFWRRWHMTLSRFLRDYVYIPLGGNRGAPLQVYATMLGTMLLCGLWHGAGWTFIAWGGLHGLAICLHRVWLRFGVRLPAVLGWGLTMLFVVAGWVLFRAEHFDIALAILRAMCGFGAAAGAGIEQETLVYLVIGTFAAVVGPTNIELARGARVNRPWVAATLALAVVLTVLRVGEGRGLEFIYFQF